MVSDAGGEATVSPAEGEPPFAYPKVHAAASAVSRRGQRLYLRVTLFELSVLAVAALAGLIAVVSEGLTQLSGAFAAGSLVTIILVKNWIALHRPERAWFDGRVAAESVKTLSWRYAAGGDPFPIGLTPEEADEEFVQRMGEIIESVDGLPLVPGPVEYQISDSMRSMRAFSLPERRAQYERHRIAAQQDWYSRKAEWNTDRSNKLSLATMVLEIIGIGVGLVVVFGADVPTAAWIGPLTTIAAGVAAWSKTRQHTALASAYGRAALELASIRSLLAYQQTEEDWARFVAGAEKAISREHTSWQAARLT